MVSLDNRGIARLLVGSRLFDSLRDEALQELAHHAVIRAAPEKAVIFEKGMPGNEMFAIFHGRVKISTSSEDGKEMIFAILEAGDFFGEAALLDGKPRSATCTAVEDCQMVVIKRADFVRYLEMNPPFAIHLLSLLSQRLRAADEQMEETNFFPLTVRLARKLAMLAAEHGDIAGAKVAITMNISQNDLGNMVSASRESINKQFSQWVREGLISLGSHSIIIENAERLHKIGKMSYTRRAEAQNQM
jgi:CRP-like cAMP-binding protein